MTIGYPLHESSKKPRLPLEHVYHEEEYEQDEQRLKEQLKEYNETVQSYYIERTGGKREDTWTGQMAQMLSHPRRMYMKEFVEKKALTNNNGEDQNGLSAWRVLKSFWFHR